MQRMKSPSCLPIERGAPRWQHRSSNACAMPVRSRQKTKGTEQILRESKTPSVSSELQAATYQQFLINISALPRRLSSGRLRSAKWVGSQVRCGDDANNRYVRNEV